MNNRRFDRLDFRAEAVIKHGEVEFRGEVENLSLKGLFIKTDNKIPLQETVGITIFFFGASAQLSFSLNGTVVRVTETGIGLNFQKIYLDSFIEANETSGMTDKPDPELMDSFYRYIGTDTSAERKYSA